MAKKPAPPLAVPPPIAKPNFCPHTQFTVEAMVQVSVKHVAPREPATQVKLRVRCKQCGQPYRFLMLAKDPVSPDQSTLAWPIEPANP